MVTAQHLRRQTKSAPRRRCGWDSAAGTVWHGTTRSCRPSNGRPAPPAPWVRSRRARFPGPCPAARRCRCPARPPPIDRARAGRRTPSGPAGPTAVPGVPAGSRKPPCAGRIRVRTPPSAARPPGRPRGPTGPRRPAWSPPNYGRRREARNLRRRRGRRSWCVGSSTARRSLRRGCRRRPGPRHPPTSRHSISEAAVSGRYRSTALPVSGAPRYVLTTRPRGLVTTS